MFCACINSYNKWLRTHQSLTSTTNILHQYMQISFGCFGSSHFIHFVFIVWCKYHHNLYSMSQISALCAHKLHVLCVSVWHLLLFNFLMTWAIHKCLPSITEQFINVYQQKLNFHFKPIYPMSYFALTELIQMWLILQFFIPFFVM